MHGARDQFKGLVRVVSDGGFTFDFSPKLAVNPDVVAAQMEGGVMFGLTAALHGQLNLDSGVIRESNFHDYPILRMNEAPEVEVIIVDSGTAPTGVGEPGLPPIAPAVANAVYRATGQRLRSLPLRLS